MTHRAWAASASALALSIALPVSAETYYVDPGGSDTDTGLMGAPWQTLQHAADSVAAGDTVVVQPGTYGGFYLSTAGTMAAPITFTAQAGAIIDSDNPTTPDGINVEGAAYVVIEGFEVVGTNRAGIRCALSDHVTIRNNTSKDNARWGIFSGFCDDLLIEQNDCSGSVDEHGIYVSNSANRPVVRANVMWNNNANGLHMNGDVSQGGDGVIEDAIVEGNVIFGNGANGGSGINCDGCQRALIRNNLIYDTHASGISLYMIDAAEGSKDNLLVNNTVLVASDGRWALNIQNGSTGNTALNNILISAHPSRGSVDISSDSLAGFVSDFNVVMDRFTSDGGTSVLTLSEWTTATAQDGSSLVATPSALFVDDAGDDYHLTMASPAVDAGTATNAPTDDLDGNARPYGSAVDIGAYEYCGNDCVPATGGAGGAGVGGGSGVGGQGSGASGSSSSGAGANGAVPSDDSGCGCRVPGGRLPRGGLVALLGLLALVLRRRR